MLDITGLYHQRFGPKLGLYLIHLKTESSTHVDVTGQHNNESTLPSLASQAYPKPAASTAAGSEAT